ncbi:transposase [Kalymmatonema gypsitolerans NIES-4073]|nr:transposase [Scytonema sp. NIES-4073]
MSKAYPSNLTRDQYELLNDLIPEPKRGGRPREVDMWEVLNAIFYVLVEGVRWRALPGDFPRKVRHSIHISVIGAKTGRGCTSTIIYESGRELILSGIEVHQKRSSISQSVKTAAMVHEAVGYNAGYENKRRLA